MTSMAIQLQANCVSASLKPSTWLPKIHFPNLQQSSVSVKPRTCSTLNARSLSQFKLCHASRNLQLSASAAAAAESVVAEESPVDDVISETPSDTEVHLSLYYFFVFFGFLFISVFVWKLVKWKKEKRKWKLGV